MKSLLALSAVVGALLLAAAAPASATAQCGPDNRWCVAVQHHAGHLVFAFAGFGYTGTYRVCVTAPKSKELCRTFGLRPNGTGANASSVQFAQHFPHQRHGRYKVRWVYVGKQVGKTMTFTP